MTASIKQLGARAKHGMANERESLVTVVIDNKLKMLRSLTKGYVGGSGVQNSPDADSNPPAERRSLTHIWYACGTW